MTAFRFIAWAGALTLTIGPALAAGGEVGHTVSASDTVTGQLAGQSDVKANNDPIFMDERIAANATGLGQFRLRDGTKLVVGPGGTVTIDRLIYSSETTVQQLTFKATKGAFRFISGSSPSEAYSIVTPSATIGVRGTVFDVMVGGAQTHLAVMAGTVNLCSGAVCRLVEACQYAVAGGGQVSDPGSIAGEVAQRSSLGTTFPLLANQSNLLPGFRTVACGTTASTDREKRW